MDRRDNPYTPNAGAKPPVLVGREQELETFEILLGRLAAARTEQSLIVVGLRGVGKTVLLGEFRQSALDHGGPRSAGDRAARGLLLAATGVEPRMALVGAAAY